MADQNIGKLIPRNTIKSVTGTSRTSGLGAEGRTKIGRVIAIIFIAVVLAIIAISSYLKLSGDLKEAKIYKYPPSLWQAVFLDNNQVYFGHVIGVTAKTITLREIYYLQVVNQPLQQSQEAGLDQNQQEQRLTLIKLGNEIHGPNDEMNINRDHVLLVENLKNDSRVVKAITKYVSEQQQ